MYYSYFDFETTTGGKRDSDDTTCAGERSEAFVPISYSLIILKDDDIFVSRYYAGKRKVAQHFIKTLDRIWRKKISPILHADREMDEECLAIPIPASAVCYMCNHMIEGRVVRDHSHRTGTV